MDLIAGLAQKMTAGVPATVIIILLNPTKFGQSTTLGSAIAQGDVMSRVMLPCLRAMSTMEPE